MRYTTIEVSREDFEAVVKRHVEGRYEVVSINTRKDRKKNRNS